MKDFLGILNYFPYLLFLIATESKEIFTGQQMKEGKKQ
jgi:hypothetical protein